MTPSIKPNPLSVPVSLQVTRPNQPASLAVSRRGSAALAVLGATLLVLAVITGVSMSAAASGGLDGIVRSVKAAFGAEEALATEQERHATEQERQASVVAVLERRVQALAAEVDALTSRSRVDGHRDAAANDRFTTLETDIAALTAEIRALRAVRTGAVAAVSPAQVNFLEATLVEVGGGVMTLRSSLDAFAEEHRKDIAELAQTHRRDIAELAQTHRRDIAELAETTRNDFAGLAQSTRKDIADLAQTQRKDIADIATRIDRIEQTLAARDVTASIKTPVRKKKVRVRRVAPAARADSELAPFRPVPSPLFPGPVVSVR